MVNSDKSYAGEMTILVRAVRPDDARACLEVHRAAVRQIAAADYPQDVVEAWAPLPVTEADVSQFVLNPDEETRVLAELDGVIGGVGAVVPGMNELRACYVRPRAARAGVGSAIVEALERIASEAGLEFLQLDSSLTASAFYRSLGYRELERITHTLSSGVPMAAVRMRKELRAPS